MVFGHKVSLIGLRVPQNVTKGRAMGVMPGLVEKNKLLLLYRILAKSLFCVVLGEGAAACGRS